MTKEKIEELRTLLNDLKKEIEIEETKLEEQQVLADPQTDPIMDPIRFYIKEYCRTNKISQNEFAKKVIGIDKATMSKWMTGDKTCQPGKKYIDKLLDILDLEIVIRKRRH